MENIFSLIKSAYEFAEGLDIEQITLLSVLVTLIIFVFDRRKDTKNVQLEARREQYKKFILLLQKSLVSGVKQDEKTLRFTFIFFFASLIPAACIAMILSKMYFGKVNWSK